MLFYKPGLLAGGPVEHVCNPQRSIGYYLEAVVLLAPFCKKPIRLNLKGVTNDRYDPTVCKKAMRQVQWNLDFTIWQGDRKIISLNRDIIVNKLPICK